MSNWRHRGEYQKYRGVGKQGGRCSSRRCLPHEIGPAGANREYARSNLSPGGTSFDSLAGMSFPSDARHAVRLLVKDPGFSGVTLATVALAVGGTASVFSVIYGVLLRPLPYEEPAGLVRVWEVHPGANQPLPGELLSNATYHAWADRSRTVQDLGTYQPTERNVSFSGTPRRVGGAIVTPSLFRMLGAVPERGRLFTEDDARNGADPVILLAHRAWQRHYGSDTDVVGRRLALDDRDYEIVGVVDPRFELPKLVHGRPELDVEFYLPLAVPPVAPDAPISVTRTVARLRATATVDQAAAEGTALARAAERRFAHLVFGDGADVEVRAMPLLDQIARPVRPALLVLAAGIGLVLFVAAANVASLLLSRNSTRGAELAIRAAMGASRTRLLRQLLTETVVFSLIGGALGLGLGGALTRTLPALAPADFPRLGDIRLDFLFLLAAVGATAFMGGAAGLVPALRHSGSMTGSARQVRGASRLGQGLIALEAALAVVLLTGGMLLARSLVALLNVDTGYDASNVLVATLHHPDAEADEAQYNLAVHDILERLRFTQGVESAGAGNMSPLGDRLSSLGFRLSGVRARDGTPLPLRALKNAVTPGYAEALGLRLVEGRLFDERDTSSPVFPFLVNETFVETYLNDGLPTVGRRFDGVFPGQIGREDVTGEVVGVVGDVLLAGLDRQPQPQIYFVVGRPGIRLRRASIVARTKGDPSAMIRTLMTIVESVDPAASVSQLGPLSDRVSVAVEEPRFFTLALTSFSGLALTLAAVGLYGVVSYAFRRRRQEFGVRVALGATRRDLTGMVLRYGLVPIVFGSTMGIVVAPLGARTLSSVLFGVTPYDAVALSMAPMFLLAVASIVCLVVARNVIAADPRDALDSE